MDIKVNDAEWKGLSKDQQAHVEAIISGFFKGSRVVASPAAPMAAAATRAAAPAAATDSICESACTILEAGAIAACNLIPDPTGIAKGICIGVAKLAGNECRKLC